uniref:Uncharacterized protein n=1 Tax=Molossus molossus TaxID=27622 RepID=A0A7J8FA32_MOLMO|nr:hypothetical protein HJG59_008544 [Molossus molossus]
MFASVSFLFLNPISVTCILLTMIWLFIRKIFMKTPLQEFSSKPYLVILLLWLPETSTYINWNRSEELESHVLTIKRNSFANPSGSWRKLRTSLGSFLNYALVQRTYTIAGSPQPETIFSPKGAARIPGLSLSEFLFSFFPRSVGSAGGGDTVEIREAVKREREGKSRQGNSESQGSSGGAVKGRGTGYRHLLAPEALFSSETVSTIS